MLFILWLLWYFDFMDGDTICWIIFVLALLGVIN